MNTPRAAWWPAAKAAVLLAGLAVIVGWAWQAHAPFAAAPRPWLLAAGTLPAFAAMLVYAQRFRHVLRFAAIELALGTTLRMQLLALFFHCFVPLSAGADLTRFARLRALVPARGRGAIAGAIVLDHFVGLAAQLVLALGLWLTVVPVALSLRYGVGAAALLAGLVATGVFVVRWQRGRAYDLPALAARVRRGLPGLAAAFAWSLVMQSLLAVAVLAGARALGIEVSFAAVLLVLAASLVFQSVPVNVAGAGAAELAGTGLYVALGVPLPSAVLLVSVLYGYRLTMAGAGGLWELAAGAEQPSVVAKDTPAGELGS